MTEKLGIDQGVARIYQFLSGYNGDWQKEADTSEDGTLIRSEMRSFLFANVKEWSGVESKQSESEDIFNKFWNSVNFSTSGKADLKGTKNKIGLDKTEMAAMLKEIEVIEVITNYVENEVSLPDGLLVAGYEEDFKNALIAILLEKAKNSQEIKNAKYDVDKKAAFDETVTNAVKTMINDSIGAAAADCYKKQAIDNLAKNNALPEGYSPNADATLDKLIKQYIDNIGKSNPTPDEIKSAIEALVADYLASAGIGNKTGASTATFRDVNGAVIPSDDSRVNTSDARIKYFLGNNSGKLTDLQAAILKVDMESDIKATLSKHSKYGEKYNAYQSEFSTLIDDYINEQLSNASMDKFNELKTGAGNAFITAKAAKLDEILTSIDAKIEELKQQALDLDTAKSNLITEDDDYLENNTDKYADIRKEAVKTAFGADDYSNVINGKTAIEEVNALSAAFKTAKAKAESDIKAAKDAVTQQDACGELATYMDVIISSKMTSLTNDTTNERFDFGIDANGNIVFKETLITNKYNYLKKLLKENLQKQNPEAYAKLTEANLDKLIQAAWIMAYTDMNSSQNHGIGDFIKSMLGNLKSILTAISKNPEYLAVYTSHTAYANTEITNGVAHYNVADTYGDDEIIDYNNGRVRNADGSVSITKNKDKTDYDETMHDVLNNLIDHYSTISADTVTEVFHQAQYEALYIAHDNIDDCPYGTGDDSTRVEDTTMKWSNTQEDRGGDGGHIDMDELVQLTLYFFDKLLYKYLATGELGGYYKDEKW